MIEAPGQGWASGLILGLLAAAGVTIVTVLHELDIVRQWFPKTLLLARHMVAFGPTDAVLTDANWQRAAGLSTAVWESSLWCRPGAGAADAGSMGG